MKYFMKEACMFESRPIARNRRRGLLMITVMSARTGGILLPMAQGCW